jgi:hypothetical protein
MFTILLLDLKQRHAFLPVINTNTSRVVRRLCVTDHEDQLQNGLDKRDKSLFIAKRVEVPIKSWDSVMALKEAIKETKPSSGQWYDQAVSVFFGLFYWRI